MSVTPELCAPSTQLSVLVVDDVEANLKLMRALLDGCGAEVVLARSGEEALRQLLRRKFAVMLLDVQMPGMDGYEVATHARSNPATRDVPIIFLTASDNTQADIERGYGSGAVDYLFKPCNPTVLCSKVRVFLELYSSRQELQEAKRTVEQANAVLEKAYSDLQNAQAQLVHSAQMASLGKLVAGIAHEVNNPLSFSRAHLDTARRSLATLATQLPSPLPMDAESSLQRASSRLGEMGVGLERIQDLVLKLRSFSRLEEGERKAVPLRDCVEPVLTLLAHRFSDKLVAEVDYGNVTTVDCYPGLLNQVLLNLVSNSIDAISEHGDGKGSVRIAAASDAHSIVIRVQDSGPGLDPSAQARLFEPFFTTKPLGAGSGLSLSISQKIIEKHGGRLALENAATGGALATITLPLAF